MQVVLGAYPMTIDEMQSWAREADSYTPAQCAQGLHKLAQSDPHEPRRK